MCKKAVILCGGLGTRLAPLTSVIPKPLLPIGEKAVIDIQIEQLKRFGFEEIYLATNYKSDYFRRFIGDGNNYGINVYVSEEPFPLGTAGPLKLLQGCFDEPFLVMNGDVITKLNFSKLYKYAIEKDSILTATTKRVILPYNFGKITFDDERITGIEEKPEIALHSLAGIYIMHPRIFNYIPANVYYGMDSLLKNLILNNEVIYNYEINEYWVDIGQIDDYFSINKKIAELDNGL